MVSKDFTRCYPSQTHLPQRVTTDSGWLSVALATVPERLVADWAQFDFDFARMNRTQG
jgi:hypothetical protein